MCVAYGSEGSVELAFALDAVETFRDEPRSWVGVYALRVEVAYPRASFFTDIPHIEAIFYYLHFTGSEGCRPCSSSGVESM